MTQYNIDKTWLLTFECPGDEYDHTSSVNMPEFGPPGALPLSRCVSYVERAPEKFVLGFAPDPRRPEAIDRLEGAIALYGVRVFGELKVRMMYDNPDALRMYRFCGQKKLPVVVHIDYEFDTGVKYPRPNWWYGGGIEALERAMQACPETIFVGHGPGFWAHISGDDQFNKVAYPIGKVVPGGKIVTQLRQYSNLYGSLDAGSGWNALNRDQEFAKEFLLEFQDRLLYGRDEFDNRHQELLNALGLPEEVLTKIYSGNALKLVPLP
jgi:hypothetical protein